MTIDEDMNCFVANTWNRKIIELRGLNEEQEKEHVCWKTVILTAGRLIWIFLSFVFFLTIKDS